MANAPTRRYAIRERNARTGTLRGKTAGHRGRTGSLQTPKQQREQQNKFGVAITEVRVFAAIVAGAIYENYAIGRPDFGCTRYRIAARADSPYREAWN